jgi:putative redox protein
MKLPSSLAVLIARCNVSSAAEDANYRQSIRCGRHEMLADERADRGGTDAGPTPFEYLLSGLGACTAITLRMYSERKGWNLGAVSVSLALRQVRGQNTIERRVTVSAPLSADQQAKLLEIAEKTPVTLAVKSGISMETTVAPTES